MSVSIKDIKIDIEKFKKKNTNIIHVPCRTGELVWFIDHNGSISWGSVVGFTETHIIASSIYTENTKLHVFLPIKEFNHSIIINRDSDKAKHQIMINIPYNRDRYWNRNDFYFKNLIKY